MPSSTTSIKVLEERVLAHFKLRFQPDDQFYWSASEQVVHFRRAQTAQDLWCLLHEIAHANLNHQHYLKDIQLLRQETEAWHTAKMSLAPLFELCIDENFIEDMLESYRGWLHSRSRCPACQQTGIQQTTSTYQCINCLCSWSVNDARLKQVRRKITSI